MDLSATDWEYVGERAGSFMGRAWVFAQLRSFLSGPPGVFLLCGDPGTGKTAVAARLAQYSCGRPEPGGLPLHPPIAEGTISAAVFCRAGKMSIPELIQRLSHQLAGSVDGFSDALQATLAPEITIRNVHVKAHEVGGDVTGVRIVLNGLSDERAFSAGVAVPLRQLRELGATAQIVLLVDAVDEAADVGEVNTFSRLLGKLDGIHVIVTARSDARVLADFRKAARTVNLVVDAPPGEDDVHDYIRHRLRGQGPEGALRVLGDRIAQEAAGNFLYAFYVIGALIQSRSLGRIDENTAHGLPLPTGGLAGVYEDFLDRQIGGDEVRWAGELRPVLAAICVALGDGFTTAQLAAVASRLTGRGFSPTKAADVTRAAGQFLDGPRPDGPFRAYHQSFTRFLADSRQNPNWPIDAVEANNAVVQALSDAVAGDRNEVKNWTAADPYTKKYLAPHAAISGRLDDFLADAGYLLAADPSRLLAVLSDVTTTAGRNAARVIRRAAHQYQTCPREEAASYLEAQARQCGFHALAEQIAKLGLPRPWTTPWAQWRPPQQRLRLAPDEEITAMTTAAFRGERVAVLAVKGGQLQIRRIGNGTNALDPLTTHDPGLETPPVTVLTAGDVDGRPVILVGDRSGSVKAWSMLADQPAVTFPSAYQTSVVALALADINGVPAVLAVGQDKGCVWRWPDGAIIDSSNFNVYIRAAAIGSYKQAPLIAYADLDRVDFKVFPVHAPAIEATASWPRLWHYDLFMPHRPQHYGDVYSLAVLQVGDRMTVISGDDEGYVWAWDVLPARRGPEITPIGMHTHSLTKQGLRISAAAIAEINGRKIAASGDSQGQIKVWDVAESRQIDSFPTAHTSEIKSLAVAETGGNAVIVSCADDAVRVWDIDESGPPAQPGFTALAFTRLHGTTVLLAGDEQGTVQVLGAADGVPVAPAFHGHSGEVASITAHSVGDEIVALSGGVDGIVQIWNPANATPLSDPYIEHGHVVTAVAARQMGGRVIAASGGYDDMVRIWDVASRALLGEPVHLGGTVPLGGVAFAELDTRSVVVTAASCRSPSIAQLWDLSDRIPLGGTVTLAGDSFGAVTMIQFGVEPLIAFSDYEGTIRLRGFTDRSYDSDFQCSQPGWSRALAAIVWGSQPVIMAGSHQNGVIDIWYARDGRHQRIDIGSSILALAAGPDRNLAVATDDGVMLVRLREP